MAKCSGKSEVLNLAGLFCSGCKAACMTYKSFGRRMRLWPERYPGQWWTGSPMVLSFAAKPGTAKGLAVLQQPNPNVLMTDIQKCRLWRPCSCARSCESALPWVKIVILSDMMNSVCTEATQGWRHRVSVEASHGAGFASTFCSGLPSSSSRKEKSKKT